MLNFLHGKSILILLNIAKKYLRIFKISYKDAIILIIYIIKIHLEVFLQTNFQSIFMLLKVMCFFAEFQGRLHFKKN